MNNFTKSDLKTGDIIVTKEKGNVILIGNRFKKFEHLNNIKGVTNINNYNDMLEEDTHTHVDKCTIEKVYRIKDGYNYSLKEIIEELPETNVELVWEREKEIDWTKVPSYTKVLVKDYHEDLWKRAYFVSRYDGYYKATFHDEFTNIDNEKYNLWDEIKFFNENDIKKEWYK